jgi:OmcA/MtrC family decaheme c-type cytochrome
LVLSAAAAVLLSGGAALISAPSSPFRSTDKAFFADEKLVNFVRPGLRIQITRADIATDGTVRALFKLTDPRGLGLDREGIQTPGTVSISFVLARIPADSDKYLAYTTRTATSPDNGAVAIQASSDSGGRFEKLADGEYAYTFATKLPAGFDRTATHSILAYSSRNLSEFDLGTNYFDTVFSWVPSGAAVTKVRDVIKTATCNKCHTDMGFHGGSRRSMEGCVMCHTPQTTDPDTGNTVDMTVMTHKIHMGAELPSNVAGEKYCIIGNRQSVHCYDKVEFVAGPNNCKSCHDTAATGATRPAQADAHLKNPSRAACGSCHDNVNFATGEGHVDLPQPNDGRCANCHIPQGEFEFDASIQGAHVEPTLADAHPGVKFEIVSVEDGVAGRKPRVTFSIKNKAGDVVAPSAMTSLNLVLAGPTTDYASYVSESARTAVDAGGGRFTHTFAFTIPATATGSFTVGMEGYQNSTLLAGTRQEMTVRDAGINVTRSFSVDGSPVVARREVVSLDKCNSCHNFLSLHGSNRNTIDQCVLCHNPNMTDAARRPADKMPAESIHMATMIHRIHAGNLQQRDYTIYGFGNTPHNYNAAGYPGILKNCTMCHINNGQQVPVKEGLLPVNDPRAFNPKPGPESAACTSCHATKAAAAHAAINSNEAIGESCSACHSSASQFSVDRVHAQ